MRINGIPIEDAPPLLFVLLGMAVFWLVLMALLHGRIARRHPDIFRQMGEPGLFLGRDGQPSMSLLKFLALRRHRGLGDRALSLLSDGMVLYYVTFTVAFVYFWIDFSRA